MTGDVVARTRAALEAIDGESWVVDPVVYTDPHGDTYHDVDGPHGGWVAHVEDAAKAYFIAAAPDLMRGLLARVEAVEADNQRLRAELAAAHPQPCQACGGRGTWETECCNGSSGCPCRGGVVQMGSCHACGGQGVVDQQQPMANANFILRNGISYPGGGPIGFGL